MAQFINLTEKGFTDAASNLGDPQVLNNYLQQIETGDILDFSYQGQNTDPLRDAEITKVRNEISSKSAISNEIQNTINSKKETENGIKSQIDKLIKNPNDPTVIPKGGMFSWPKFISLLMIFIGLSIFLFLYYSGIPYQAFRDCVEPVGIFPTLYEYLNFVFPSLFVLVAFVFFAFGIGLHFAIEISSNRLIKSILIILIIMITFILDVFMAIRIHDCQDLIFFEKTGSNLAPWYKSNIVFVLFLLGFVTFFLWSFLYHNLLNEISKRSILTTLQNNLAKISDMLESLNSRKTDIDSKLNILQTRKENLENLNIPVVITEQINQSKLIYTGSFMTIFNNPIPNANFKRSECERIYEKFKM